MDTSDFAKLPLLEDTEDTFDTPVVNPTKGSNKKKNDKKKDPITQPSSSNTQEKTTARKESTPPVAVTAQPTAAVSSEHTTADGSDVSTNDPITALIQGVSDLFDVLPETFSANAQLGDIIGKILPVKSSTTCVIVAIAAGIAVYAAQKKKVE